MLRGLFHLLGDSDTKPTTENINNKKKSLGKDLKKGNLTPKEMSQLQKISNTVKYVSYP